jgi:hypothetical protein
LGDFGIDYGSGRFNSEHSAYFIEESFIRTELTAFEIKEQYLVDYLQEEFGKNPKLRLRILKEDKERGVVVKSPSREYFFPFSWAMNPDLFKNVRAQVQEILDKV